MILSVSRRTDIPAFCSDWFYNRVKEGFVFTRNPLNPKQISKILINTEVVDCIVFWTKNPAPMLARLDEIKAFPYYFHFTLTSYNQTLERRVPKKKQIVDTFRQLAEKVGKQRVIWRYDPVLFTNEIDANYHIKYFEWLAKRLAGYTEVCKIGFIHNYKKTVRNMKPVGSQDVTEKEMDLLASSFAEIGKMYGIELQACTAKYHLENLGVNACKCIDGKLIENIIGYNIVAKKDKNQRKDCNCIESIDIGEYHTCLHNCLYCYANDNDVKVQQKYKLHNPTSPILVGEITETELAEIKNRKCVSFKEGNHGMFSSNKCVVTGAFNDKFVL